MPKAIKKRTKKKISEETDVKGKLHDIKDKIQQRQKTVFTYSILSVVFFLVVAGIFFYQNHAASKSRQLEQEAYKIYHNIFQTKPLAKQEQFQQALDLFKQAYSKKKSSRTLFYIANACYELEKYDDALSNLNELIKRFSREKDILPLAYHKIAMINLKKGNMDEALKTLDILYKSDSSIYKDLALVESARILEKQGKKDVAKSKYKELSEKFSESPFITEAKAKLEEKKEKENK